MTLAAIFSVGNGASIVFYSIPLGGLIEAFSVTDQEKLVDAVIKAMIGFFINNLVVFFNCWLMTAIWTVTSERQMIKAR